MNHLISEIIIDSEIYLSSWRKLGTHTLKLIDVVKALNES